MATVSSGWVGGDDWQIRLDYSITNINGNTARITCTSSINNRYASINSGAVVRTTVNGSTYQQTIAPIKGSGVKWGAQHSWDVHRNHDNTNYGINVTATMPGSSLSAYRGGTYLNTSVTASAADHHTFTYNANGGTANGAGTYSNTKWYGEHYYIPNLTMARNGYDFLGWAESPSATSVSKHLGDEETRDQDLTFYAVWKRRYIPPAIGKLTATRSDSAGTALDTGTYAKVTCEWSVDTTLKADNTVSSVTVATRKRGDTEWGSEVALTAGGTTSGTATGVVGTFDVGYAYDLRVTVTDPGGSATQTTVVTPSFFTMDFLKGGKGIAFGKAATAEGVDFGMGLLRDGQPYLPPHVETLFNSPSGTPARSVTISKDVTEFDAIRIYATKKDGADWNVVSSEAPVVTRSGTTGAFGSATVFYTANSTTQQLISFAWCFKSGNRKMDYSFAEFVNFTNNGKMITGGNEALGTKLYLFRVLGIKYM